LMITGASRSLHQVGTEHMLIHKSITLVLCYFLSFVEDHTDY
jgi:hypothetical protein